jgi:hypothetical protein
VTEAVTFGRRILGASPAEIVAAELATGRQEHFAPVDDLVAGLLRTSFAGRRIFSDGLIAVVPDQATLMAATFAVAAQQARGAWWMPDDAPLKVGLLNLPSYLLGGRRFSYGIARDEQFPAKLPERPDWVAIWSVLQPLFSLLLAPIELRSQRAGTLPADEAKRAWADADTALANLGLDATSELGVMRYGSGWSKLRAEEQRRAKVAFAKRLAPQVGVDTARRFRALRTAELVKRYYAKAKRGSPTQREVVTRALGQVLAGHFGGDWLAFLDYLGEVPAASEEVTTVLPRARLFAAGSERITEVAAAKGLAAADVEAMLASFYGEASFRSPVERRVEILRKCWAELDAAHASQASDMAPLGEPYQRELRRAMFSDETLEAIASLWDGTCLPRWPDHIVTATDPLRAMTVAFGPALQFWHDLGINTWSLTEGPYAPASLDGLAGLSVFHRAECEALAAGGWPIDPALFADLEAAERQLGPSVEVVKVLSQEVYGEVSMTMSTTTGRRRTGFVLLRDIVTAYRRDWAAANLDFCLRGRWESEVRQVAWEHNRWLAAKGKAPTLKQFAKIAAPAANNWFGGDIADLFGAFGEKAPARAQRVRLMPANREAFVHAVWEALGGEEVDPITWRGAVPRNPQWTIRRLADESLRFVQLQEALDRPPTVKELLPHHQWPEDVEALWPTYTRVVEQVRTRPSRAGPGAGSLAPPSPALPAVQPERSTEMHEEPHPTPASVGTDHEPKRRSILSRFRRVGD